MPANVRQRIFKLAGEFQSSPGTHLKELRELVTKYPQIAMLRNHLAGALSLTGQREEAKRVIAETAKKLHG